MIITCTYGDSVVSILPADITWLLPVLIVIASNKYFQAIIVK